MILGPESDLASLPPGERRYEPFVRPVPAGTPVRTGTWRHRRWDVHVEAIGHPQAPARALLIHGAGWNAAAMRPFAVHMAARGLQVHLVDLPGYGLTRPARDPRVTYGDWQELLIALAAQIAGQPGRASLTIIGASIGGMLAYDVGAVSPHADAVVATCLLDLSDAQVLARVARPPGAGRITPGALALARGPLTGVFLPLRTIALMERIANHSGLVAQVAADPRGGAGAMPLGWYRSLVESGPLVAPEDYAGPPVTLLHPAEDRWTPAEVSLAFHDRLATRPGHPHAAHLLEGCGHFPVEEPGFTRLLDAVSEIARGVAPPSPRP